jgi:hypothetical protein
MINWQQLLDEEVKTRAGIPEGMREDDWRQEAAYSLCELYYTQYRTQRGYGTGARIDLRPGSDFNCFLDSHMKPLGDHGVWEALFPNHESATSAGAIDEALHLLADSKLVDRVYSGDIITVNRIVGNIRKKRAKFLDNL